MFSPKRWSNVIWLKFEAEKARLVSINCCLLKCTFDYLQSRWKYSQSKQVLFYVSCTVKQDNYSVQALKMLAFSQHMNRHVCVCVRACVRVCVCVSAWQEILQTAKNFHIYTFRFLTVCTKSALSRRIGFTNCGIFILRLWLNFVYI